MARDRQTPAAANDRRRERLPDGLVHDHMEGALDRPRDPLPTRVQDLAPLPAAYATSLDAGLARARARPSSRARATRSTPTSASCSPGRRPSTSPRSATGGRRPAPRPRLAGRRAAPRAPAASRASWTSARAAASRACRSPWRSASDRDAARGLRRQEGPLPAHGGRGDRPGAPRRRGEARAEVLARDPRDREAWPAVTARAVTRSPSSWSSALPLVAPGGVLVAWKRVPLDEELDAAGGRPGGAAGRARSRSCRAGVPGPRGPSPGRSSRAAADRRPLPARSGGAPPPAARDTPVRRPGVPRARAALPSPDARRRPLRHPREPRRARRRARAVPSVDEVWHLGDVVGYGPAPGRGRRAAAGDRRASACAATTTRPRLGGPRDRVVQRRRAPGDGVDARDDQRRDAGLAGRPAGDGSSARASRSSTAARATRSGST